jgi:Flp pilus assembly protein TadG
MNRRRITKNRVARKDRRWGVITVMTAFGLVAVIGFVALGIDMGYIAYEKQKMRNACDAAALAAAMEITHAIEEADADVGDAAAYAREQAKLMAVDVAAMNGQYIDPDTDVQFGRRSFNSSTGNFEINWGDTPSNVIRVHCRKDNPDSTAPDARVRTYFAHIIGSASPDLTVSAIATVESRDIVSVLDFSRSMNFDSYFNSEASTLPSQAQIESNLSKVWDDLGQPSFGTMPFEPDWVTIPSSNWGEDLTVRWESESVVINCTSNLQRVQPDFQQREYADLLYLVQLRDMARHRREFWATHYQLPLPSMEQFLGDLRLL